MPWKKIGKNKYKSKSGRIWTLDQIRAYLAKKKRGIKSKLGG